jgi:hypothetical protein
MRLDSPFQGGQSGPSPAVGSTGNMPRAQAGNIGRRVPEQHFARLHFVSSEVLEGARLDSN